jgi:hypothetical protein
MAVGTEEGGKLAQRLQAVCFLFAAPELDSKFLIRIVKLMLVTVYY